MIAPEKSHKNISDYRQFLFKKRFEIDNKLSSEKMKNSDNYI